MRVHFKALASYADGNLTSQALVADKVELIQMLFDGLVDSLSVAKGHIEHKALDKKAQALNRASRILVGLKSALDFSQGGDLANNLNELYDYALRRILHANLHNDVNTLSEIQSLMAEIQQAWRAMPGLVPARTPAGAGASVSSLAVH